MTGRNIYLGLNAGYNSSAAIIIDGKVVVAAQEERFSRRKIEVGYPKLAIEYCLKYAGIEGKDITKAGYTTIYKDPYRVKSKLEISFGLEDYHSYFGEGFFLKRFRGESTADWNRWLRDDPRFTKENAHFDFSFLTDDMLDDMDAAMTAFREEEVRTLHKHIGIPKEKIEFIDHHTAHAYYAYYASPFRRDDCIVLCLDGWGDGRNLSIWKVQDDALELISESGENDVGRVYKFATLHLAMRPEEHEFKVMGMAPYAKDEYVERCLSKFRDVNKVEGMKIVHGDRPKDLYSFCVESWKTERFDNICGAVQKFTEEKVTQLVKNICAETGIGKFVLSGGIAMNVKMSQCISQLDCVEDICIPGSPSDETLCIGGAYFLNDDRKSNMPLDNMYLGYDISNDIDGYDWGALQQKFEVTDNVSNEVVADLLARGDIIARVNERCEFGARALGNRSILANPSNKDVVKEINEAVKNRDFWMPFALSILDDYKDEYIDNPKNIEARFMTIAMDTKPEKYEDIRAGTHPYDRTVRPQFVLKDNETSYYEIINAFRKKTGIPALLNTSFNLHGKPIVNTIEDSIETFEKSGIHHLLIGNKLVSKQRSIQRKCA